MSGSGKSSMPTKFAIMVVPHRKFSDCFACRVSVPFEGHFWIVDAKRNVDCFRSRDAAMSAGAAALMPYLNKRITVPRPGAPTPEDCSPRVARHGRSDIEFGFFGVFKEAIL